MAFAKRVGGGAGCGDRFLRVAQRLVGKASQPKDKAQESVALHAGVEAIAGRFGAVALGIVKRETIFQMPARRGEVTQAQVELAEQVVGSTEEKRVSGLPGKLQSLRGDRERGTQLSPVHLDDRKGAARPSDQNLRRRIGTYPPSQLDRPLRGPLPRRRRNPLFRHIRPGKSGLDEKLLFIAPGTFGKPLEDLEASVQMRDGFEVCRTLGRPLAGVLPPRNRLFEESRFGQVPGKKLALGRDGFGKVGLQDCGDAGV
jgi:hypothetical protein